MPQFEFDHPILVNGQISESGPRKIDSLLNELLAQETEVPIGGTTDGTYTVQIDGEEGIFQVSFVAVAQTADQIADGLAAAILADVDLINIVDASSTSGTPLELDFLHAGKTYTITFPSNPGGNMSVVVVQAAGGTDVQLAVAVVQGSTDETALAPDSGSVDADIVGFTVRNMGIQVNSGIQTNTDVVSPGEMLSVMSQGNFVGQTETAVVKGADVFIRIDSPGAGQFFGGLRNDVDGGNAIQVLGCVFNSTLTAAGLAKVRVNRPA